MYNATIELLDGAASYIQLSILVYYYTTYTGLIRGLTCIPRPITTSTREYTTYVLANFLRLLLILFFRKN